MGASSLAVVTGTKWSTLRPLSLWVGSPPSPRLLYGFLRTHLRDAGPREGHNHSHHVNCELELQELGDAVIDIAAPHHCLDDTAEIVVCQDDV